jgi:putative spermidine/putrescine transport system ATP-binding protein
MVLLEVKQLVKKRAEGYAIHNISFSQNRGEKIAVAGETGSGKTSLLKMIGGLVQPDAGEVLFEGKKVEGPFERLIPGHPQIAYLSQYFELRNNYEVHELLEMAGHLEDNEILPLFQLCRIEHLLKRKTTELSGGEKQRIVLAMQLVKKPKLLLLDEPFSNMDAIHTAEMKAVVHDVAEEKGVSVIMVSHNGKDVLPWADKIFIMQEGNFVQQGTPQEIYHSPVNEYCAGLFGDYNSVPQSLFSEEGKKNQKLIIRPEQFHLSSTPGRGIKASVQSVLFYGSYYHIKVKTGKSSLLVSSASGNWKKGEEVYMIYKPPVVK